MFSWFRRTPASRPAPASNEANPGVGVKGRLAITRGDRTWTEEADAVESAARALRQLGHKVVSRGTWLRHRASGLVIRPQLVEAYATDNGAVQTVTTIEVSHPDVIPHGVFEYQHSVGEGFEDAIGKGFEQWAQVDLVPLLDAFRPRPTACTVMTMSFGEEEGRPARHRRAILGPVAHFMATPPAPRPEEGGSEGPDEEHPFCSCCLLTNTLPTFKDLLEADAFCGIRFFAARDQDGIAQADCRVNGEDWEPGAEALREYVRTWPGSGYEFRKQYVVLQSVDRPPVAGA